MMKSPPTLTSHAIDRYIERHRADLVRRLAEIRAEAMRDLARLAFTAVPTDEVSSAGPEQNGRRVWRDVWRASGGILLTVRHNDDKTIVETVLPAGAKGRKR